MTVTENDTTVTKSDTRPTVEEMFANLQHQMDLVYRPRETDQRKRWFEEANKRLLGMPGDYQDPGSGLYFYLDNHLQPGKDFLAYAREELLDAINQVGVLSGKQRMDEGWGHVKERLVVNAIESMFMALKRLEAAQEAKE